jgi:hypothetical protein
VLGSRGESGAAGGCVKFGVSSGDDEEEFKACGSWSIGCGSVRRVNKQSSRVSSVTRDGINDGVSS